MTNATVARIAEDYGLTTLDKVEPPKRGRDRWPQDIKEEFRKREPAAVWFAGFDGPMPRSFGDNRGAWPVKIGTTTTWADNVTPMANRWSPLCWQGLWFRVWTQSDAHAKQLAMWSVDILAEGADRAKGRVPLETEIVIALRARKYKAEQLSKGFIDLTPDFDLPIEDKHVCDVLGLPLYADDLDTEAKRERKFRILTYKLQSAVMDLAKSQGYEVWTDYGLFEWLSDKVMERNLKKVGR